MARAWNLVRSASESAGVTIAPLERLEDAERVRAVIDAVPISISVKDRDLTYLMVNRHLTNVFGFDAIQIALAIFVFHGPTTGRLVI